MNATNHKDIIAATHLYSQGLDVVRAVCAAGEIAEIELDLVPAIIQTHRHCADKGLHARGRLVVGCPEPAAHILVVQHLNAW